MEIYSGVERRRYPRLYQPFSVLVRGVDTSGEVFESDTVLDNVSSGGLYVRLTQRVEPGARLTAVIRFSTRPPCEAPAPRVVVRSVVVRVEPRPDGRYGVGVAFTSHRFL